MEILLNIAWAVCSLALIGIWAKSAPSNRVPRRMQILSLAMVVLLLLPVISLSDDLMAAQSPAETDSCGRRALHAADIHPTVVPAAWAIPAAMVTELSLSGFRQDAVQSYRLPPSPILLPHALASRPPPQA